MFLLFGRKTKFRPLPDERQLHQRCPACNNECTIVACERVRTYEAYFVGLFDTREAVWVCTACQQEVELDLPPDPRAFQAREGRRRQIAERADAVKRRVEDELSALKARLGRR